MLDVILMLIIKLKLYTGHVFIAYLTIRPC